MENKNTPIYPIADLNNHPSLLFGLTKREYFVGLAMQGLLSNQSITEHHGESAIKWITEHSIKQADEILKQLGLNIIEESNEFFKNKDEVWVKDLEDELPVSAIFIKYNDSNQKFKYRVIIGGNDYESDVAFCKLKGTDQKWY